MSIERIKATKKIEQNQNGKEETGNGKEETQEVVVVGCADQECL
jgi:hypothetical protein